MIIELVPLAPVKCVSGVVTGAQLALVIRHGEEIVEGAIGRTLATHHELGHIQAILREVD